MLPVLINTMIYLGSILMVYNIYRYAKYLKLILNRGQWESDRYTLYTPLVLLVMFLAGYLFVGVFGQPDVIMSAILFFGSVYVAIIVHVLHRITDKIQENEHLQAELMASEESSRAKTSFLSNMSHEIRTPMNAIIGLDNIALRDPNLPPHTRIQLEKIHTSAEHLLDLINGILDMTRIESGKMELKMEVFSLPELLNQVNVIIQGQCDDKGLNYVVDVGDGLNGCFIGDSTRIRQVLINILGNAVKFTPSSGTVFFSVEDTNEEEDAIADNNMGSADLLGTKNRMSSSDRTDAKNRMDSANLTGAANHTKAEVSSDEPHPIRFTIRDTGIGMEKEFLSKVFDPFTQEDSTNTNRYGGSGLGLSLTKRYVDLMKGTLTVQSEKGKGSTFILGLFLMPAKSDPNAVCDPAVSHDSAGTRNTTGSFNSAASSDPTTSSTDILRHNPDGTQHNSGSASIAKDATTSRQDGTNPSLTAADALSGQADTHIPSDDSNTASTDVSPIASIDGRHVLVVEDVDMNAEILFDLLEFENVTTEWARNGQEAVDMFNDSEPGHFDAVLMDMRMPVMDGLTATRHIRALPKPDAKTVPIIALTANAFEEDIRHSFEAGMDAHLSKPIEPEVLYETLGRLIGKNKAEKE